MQKKSQKNNLGTKIHKIPKTEGFTEQEQTQKKQRKDHHTNRDAYAETKIYM